jgi:hypothetical protein
MDGMILTVVGCVIVLIMGLAVVYHARHQANVMRQVVDAYGEAMTKLAQDAFLQSKAANSDEAVRAMSAAAYEREALKQQVADHEAWRYQVMHDNTDDTPVDRVLPDGKITLDNGQEYSVKDRDGKKILINDAGEEYDILAGA